jgi:hypothetical protein
MPLYCMVPYHFLWDYKKYLGRIFGAATPLGAQVRYNKNPAKDFCSGDLNVACMYVSVRPCVCVLVANGSLDLAARATVLQAFLFD